jgi:rhamnosyltransferase
MMATLPQKIAALIVAYNPDIDKIRRLIELVIPQVDHVLILDNGAPSDLCQAFVLLEKLTYLPMSGNVGIGSALNIGVEHAVNIGCSHVITFDQDSAPAANMVEQLIAAMNQLLADGHRVAAVGPSFADHRQSPPMNYPFYRKIGLFIKRIHCCEGRNTVEADSLITSGCLIPISIFNEETLFNEGLFIDLVDSDWCFKVRAQGFSLFGVCDATMIHEPGDGETKVFVGIRLIEYSPLRRYYYFRNTILFIKRSYVPWPWRFKLAIGMFLRVILLPMSPGGQKWRQLAMMIKGIAHGLIGITGSLNDQH